MISQESQDAFIYENVNVSDCNNKTVGTASLYIKMLYLHATYAERTCDRMRYRQPATGLQF